MKRVYSSKWSGKECFLIYADKGQELMKRNVALWHLLRENEFKTKPTHSNMYTFRPTEQWNAGIEWSEEKCRELLADLKQPTPSVKVIQFSVDGTYIFSDIKVDMKQRQKIPKEPSMQRSRITIEPQFICYGKHLDGNDQEYCWGLTPDKPKRQGIKPGDKILVWARRKKSCVICTRIVPAEESNDHPTCWVICKAYYQNARKKTPEELEEIAKTEKIKGSVPPQFICYGKHLNGYNKEYCWGLIPDKPKRQGIMPGDKILVWSAEYMNYLCAICTRIVPAEESNDHPTCRVFCKVDYQKTEEPQV